VEILTCLRAAHAFPVPEKLSRTWKQYVAEATKRTTGILEQLVSLHGKTLTANKAFGRYRRAVLEAGRIQA
jgi:hypothetical protein